MPKKSLLALAVALLASPALAQSAPQGERGDGVPAFWIRPGYKVTVAASLPQPRFLELGPDGTLYVGHGNTRSIRRLTPQSDGTYKLASTFVDGLQRAHGIYMADDGYLYYSTFNAIYRTKPTGDKAADVQTCADKLVDQPGGHWYRPVFVVGGYLWTGIGDPENLSDQTNTDREKLWRYKVDPATGALSDKTLWVTGIRNTEKLRFRPGTTEMFGCDHGSDQFGGKYGENGGRGNGPITDLFPPCEFNRYIQGFNYGHPFVTGIGLPRPEHAQDPDILQRVDNNTPPAWSFGAHNAPNGWTFLSKDALGMKGDALVCLHGSWNSRKKVGYQLARILFDDVTHKPFGQQMIVGTLAENGTETLGRPCDALELPDGSVLFSDDDKGKIFRLAKLQ